MNYCMIKHIHTQTYIYRLGDQWRKKEHSSNKDQLAGDNNKKKMVIMMIITKEKVEILRVLAIFHGGRLAFCSFLSQKESKELIVDKESSAQCAHV